MDSFSEVFLEQDWDDVEQVRQNALKRVAELKSQGFECTLGLFYNVLSGNRIYVVDAALPIESEPIQQKSKPRSHSKRPQRPNPSRPSTYETR